MKKGAQLFSPVYLTKTISLRSNEFDLLRISQTKQASHFDCSARRIIFSYLSEPDKLYACYLSGSDVCLSKINAFSLGINRTNNYFDTVSFKTIKTIALSVATMEESSNVYV